MNKLKRVKKLVNWLIFNEYAENDAGVAKKIGYTKSSFSQIMNAKVPLSNRFIDKLCSVDENINKVWVNTGQGEMLQGAEPAAQQPAAVKEPAAPPPAGGDVIAIYKELLRERDEKIAQQAEQMGVLKNENKHQNEQFRKISSENERLKNENMALQNDISAYRKQIVELQGLSEFSEIPLNFAADPPVSYNKMYPEFPTHTP
jgi:predicted transcriptional regulator